MKTLEDAGNGIAQLVSDGLPPLKHEEWVEEQEKAHARDLKRRETAEAAAAKARAARRAAEEKAETAHEKIDADLADKQRAAAEAEAKAQQKAREDADRAARGKSR
jgi:hypothetical protein